MYRKISLQQKKSSFGVDSLRLKTSLQFENVKNENVRKKQEFKNNPNHVLIVYGMLVTYYKQNNGYMTYISRKLTGLFEKLYPLYYITVVDLRTCQNVLFYITPDIVYYNILFCYNADNGKSL